MFGPIARRTQFWLSALLVALLCQGCVLLGKQIAKAPESTPENKEAKASESPASPKSTEGELEKPKLADDKELAALDDKETKKILAEEFDQPKPPSEADEKTKPEKKQPPAKKFANAREAALETARSAGSVGRIIICPFSYDGTWQVIMYGDAGSSGTVREFVWNQQQGVLEPTMTYPATREERETLQKRYEAMEKCETLIFPVSDSESMVKPRIAAEKRPVEAAEKKTEVIKATIPPDEPPVKKPEPAVSKKADAGLTPEDSKSVSDFLNDWKTAWESKDLEKFKRLYHHTFRSGRITYDQFMDQKRALFAKYPSIQVGLDNVQVSKVHGGFGVRFVQTFQGSGYRDKGLKRMTVVGGKDKGFLIVSEEWSPL